MAYNTKRIKTDVDGKPIPQVFNPALDEYEALKGDAGAARHIIYGADGNPIATAGNKLAVRASEVETLLNDIKGKDFATQTTLSQILAKIIAAPSTEAKQDALAALIGEVQASPTENTLLARIKALETKIDAITAGTTPATVQLSGSILAEQKTQANAVANVITFTENINVIEIFHNETNWQTFTVNGITLTVPAGGYRTPVSGTPAKTVTIPAGVKCIVGRLI